MATVFEGIRVLDFSQGIAGNLATMIMADNGAEVFKVEPPGGDPDRARPAWRMWNRGKKSAVLDLSIPEGRRSAQGLAAAADVLVETFRPGAAEDYSIGYDTLAEGNPRLVYCSITPLGRLGSYTDLPLDDGVLQAKIGGFVEIRDGWFKTGATDPQYRSRPQASYGAANLAVQGIAAALRARERTGLGQRADTTLYHGWNCFDTSAGLRTQVEMGLASGNIPIGGASSAIGNVSLPYLATRCKDGRWMQLANNANRLFPNWMRVIGLEYIYDDPRFKGAPFNLDGEETARELRRLIVERMLEKTFDEWMELFLKNDVAGDEFLTTQQFMDHSQVSYVGGAIEVEDPEVGPTKQIGPLVRFSETPSAIGLPAPGIGEHQNEVQSWGKASASEVREPSAATELRTPLEGALVLDFSTWLAAPLGPSLMADLGARVIKIEPPGGDEFRRSTKGMGRTFAGKENLVIDMKTEEGRSIAHKLVERADAVVHNMRGEAPSRIGIDYETLRRVNPEIVYLYAGSYGSTGPGAGRGAFHPIGGAMTGGALWQLGRGNEPPPNDVPMSTDEVIEKGMDLLRANEGSPDVTSAIAVGSALAMALFEKERTGRGQYIETSMLISNGYMASEDFIQYEGKVARPEPDRNLRGLHALYRLYQAASGWVFLECRSQEKWESLCRAIGRQELLKDVRFATAQARSRHDGALVSALSQTFAALSGAEWETALRSQGVTCIQADKSGTAEFLLTDHSVKRNGYLQAVDHAPIGHMLRHGPPVAFSRTPGKVGPVHLMGEDTPAILEEIGFTSAEIEDLRSRKVVYWPDPAPAGSPAAAP